jgi:hypothetical protein
VNRKTKLSTIATTKITALPSLLVKIKRYLC